MKKVNQDNRKEKIRVAAYALLVKRGYKGASMLAIAKEARASNETLYAWYGTKQNLFRTLIEENAKEVADAINESLQLDANLEEALIHIGSLILKLVTSTRAISLNRAAAAEVSETNTLGKVLADAGRESIFPLLESLFCNAQSKREIAFEDSNEIVSIYLGLLLGDIQIRRAIGAIEALSDKDIKRRSSRATTLLFIILSDQRI